MTHLEISEDTTTIMVKNKNEKFFYHGTSSVVYDKIKKEADERGLFIMPPSFTSTISEKGRKKNLDKVFFTKDYGSALIYAGRAKNALGGSPVVFCVQVDEEPIVINNTPGTTVYAASKAKIYSVVTYR